MADSDNSRTLPVVTRRRLLSTSAASLAVQVGDVNAAPYPGYGWPDGGDPTLMVWQEWKAAHDQVEKFCREQQRLETVLIEAVGFPHVDIALPDQDRVVVAFTMEEIDRRLGDAPENASAKVQAKAVLAERHAAWEALDERMGYSRAKQAEEEAFEMRGERFNDLFAMPVRSVAGAAAKLNAILIMGEEDGASDGFPWLQIRSVVTHLINFDSESSSI